MTDEQFTEWLREHAAAYNAPPAVPSELVWSRIAPDVERIVGRHADAAPSVRAVPAPPARELGLRHVWWRSAPVAGALFTAAVLVGIAVGRFSTWGAPATTPMHVAAAPAMTPAPAPVHAPTVPSEPPMIVPVPGPGGEAVASSPERRLAHDAPRHKRSPVSSRAAERMVAELPKLPRPGEAVEAAGAARDPGSVYTMTRDLHLAESEALLSAFRTDVKAGRVDPALTRMARDLLARTRVLYDSPATRDARMKALLGDLELTLIQLATYRPGRASDLKMASEAMEQSGLLPRLREVNSL